MNTNTSTQKVRIKVLIGPSGNYCGYGWRAADSKDADDTLYEVITEYGAKEYWITAELPIPNATTPDIEAEVE